MLLIRLFGLACVLSACSTMTYTHGVPNLVKVEADLLRGGQPTRDGWRYLKSVGVRTVVKLNEVDEVDDTYAEMLGFKVLRFGIPPSDDDDLFRGPSDDEIVQAVEAVADPQYRPTFVHCTHGHDRTGLIVGVYRLRQGWTKKRAYSEMLSLHFHPELLGLKWAWDRQPE